MDNPGQSGTLYIVATPIGNLADISYRMVEVLSEVDLIACEDTRHTRKLLSHLKITAPLTSYYREKEHRKTRTLLDKLNKGESIALVSDAGTPGLSDPGAVLVRAAKREHISVVPVPGPSALSTALSVAGLQNSDFYFGGFPAAKRGERRKKFSSLKFLDCPLIFYESPHRIQTTLQDCFQVFGNRNGQIFRELTKVHEQHLMGTIEELIRITQHKIRGELVLIIEGLNKEADRPDNLDDLILWYRNQGQFSLKDAARCIAADLDLSRSQVYQRALSLWHGEEHEPD